MAWGQVHLWDVGHVPCAHDHAPGVGSVFYLLYDFGDLVYVAAVVVRPRPPLVTVDMPEVSGLIGPLVPDAHAVFLQIFHVCVAFQEPQKFMYDGFEVKLFSGEQRKPLREIEAHLTAEHADGAGAGAVGLGYSVVEYVFEQVEVLSHVIDDNVEDEVEGEGLVGCIMGNDSV